jgi:hypothetical protein
MVFFEGFGAFSADNIDLGHLQLRPIATYFFSPRL